MTPASRRRDRIATLALVVTLLLSAATSLYVSSNKLLWEDELFEFYSDARPTFSSILSAQRNTPFSLEPPAFHLLLHAVQRLPLRPEIATRLPSLAAFLLTQGCLFVITGRLTRSRSAGLLAAALPLTLTTLEYSAEARVYSMLVGTYALAFVCYQQALSARSRRRLASLGLFLCLSLGILLHYYALLLPLPFLVAEALRLWQGRDRHFAPLLAVLASFATFALDLPFLAGLREIRSMYFDSGETSWDMTGLTYLWIAVRNQIYDIRNRFDYQAPTFCGLALFGVTVLLWFTWRRLRQRDQSVAQQYVALALAAGLLIPIANLLLGRYRSHAYTPRYSLPVAVPLIVLLCVPLSRLLQRRWRAAAVLCLVMVAGVAGAYQLAQVHRAEAAALRASLLPTPSLTQALQTVQDQHLYLQSIPPFITSYFYGSPELRRQLVDLQSIPLEWQWQHEAIPGLFSRNMRLSSPLPVLSYEELRARHTPFLMVVYGESTEWLPRELAAQKITVHETGTALGGRLFHVDAP